MDEHLLKLGISDVLIRAQKEKESFDQERVSSLMKIIQEVESLMGSIERKGIPFREFLSARREDLKLPQFLVTLGDSTRFVYTEEELVELKKEDEEMQREKHEEKLQAIPEEEQTEEDKKFRPKSLPVIEIYDSTVLSGLEEKLSGFNLRLEQYLTADGHLFTIHHENDQEMEVYTLKEVIDFLRINGKKGIEIQRYKGLGEMNADQLWETTMDPEKRTLVQVQLSDAIAADKMFSMLMGEEVSPRRSFIEQHALSVKNLDV
jgi:DNA gyrase subunit B